MKRRRFGALGERGNWFSGEKATTGDCLNGEAHPAPSSWASLAWIIARSFFEAAGLVRELQFEAIIRRLMDRAELQQRARRTGEGRHLDDRGVSRRVARDVQGRVAGGTRLDRVGHFMMCEVVERQFSGFHVRNAARHGAISSTPNDPAIT